MDRLKSKWYLLATVLGGLAFAVAFSVALAATVVQITREVPGTLTVAEVQVLADQKLALFHDPDESDPVTSLEFVLAGLQPPLEPVLSAEQVIYIANRSDVDLAFVAPDEDFIDPDSGSRIAHIWAAIYDMAGEYRGNTTCCETMIAAGETVQASVSLDNPEPGLEPGDYSFTVVFGAIGEGEDEPQVIFEDDFEYDDSLSNHGWVILHGDPHTAPDPQDSSNRVAYIQSRAEDFAVAPTFSHSFNELPLEPGMELSIRFYDTGESCNNCDVFVNARFDSNSKYVNIGWYNTPTSFALHYAFENPGSQTRETGGLRSVGWHTFTWRVDQGGGIDILIDEDLILDDLMGAGDTPAVTLSKFVVVAGSDPSTYSFSVDDFLLVSGQ